MHSCWSKRSEACSYKRSEIRSEKRSYKNYLKGAVPYTHYETPSFKTLPAENWNFRRRRKRFRKKIRTFDAVENASGEKLGLSTPSKEGHFEKLLEKLPCFDRGAGEAAAETEGFIHTKRKPPLTPTGSSPKSRGAFQLLSDHIFLFMTHPLSDCISEHL